MKFSLILATLGRTTEVERFLASLAAQVHREFELIVVDQNSDDRLVDLIRTYSAQFQIVHLRSAPGLSLARNKGLARITGEVIAFPDDDCWYPAELLGTVDRWFLEHPDREGVTGASRDANGSSSHLPWPERSAGIDSLNVWRRAVSFSIFLRRDVVASVGRFDETLGLGTTPWGSGEETDYLLRALQKGFRIDYDPEFIVFHPQPVQCYDDRALIRGRNYGQGMGRVLRKHDAPIWFVAVILGRALAGAALSACLFRPGAAAFHWNVFLGRLAGWRSSSDRADP